MTFATNEREFLRIAAMAKPDWGELARLCRTAMDYGLLRRTALLHQLDGVVAWRLLDARLDGIVPNIVRDDCQQYLDWCNGWGSRYWDAISPIIEQLDDADITYVFHGGPAIYAVLGIPNWPRCWLDIDLCIRSSADKETTDFLADLGIDAIHKGPQWHRVGLLEGYHCDIYGCLRVGTTENYFVDWDIYAGRQKTDFLGHSWWVSTPLSQLLLEAISAHGEVHWKAFRLPLWSLAFIANVLHEQECCWEGLAKLINDDLVASSSIALAWEDTGANWVLWVLDVMARVYDTKLPDAITKLMAEQTARLNIWRPGDESKGFSAHSPDTRRVKWRWPGDESFLFDHQLSEGAEARIKTGLWQVICEGEVTHA
jgi:hypothetical protein